MQRGSGWHLLLIHLVGAFFAVFHMIDFFIDRLPSPGGARADLF
tara:strand:+ start:38 stop:169 length:132 start_codon:yes stop_codon:yes gene_type:complete